MSYNGYILLGIFPHFIVLIIKKKSGDNSFFLAINYKKIYVKNFVKNL